MEISTTLQDQFANAIDTAVGATGYVRFYSAAYATKLADAALNNPAFDAAASGVITLDVDPVVQDTSPAAAGTCALMALYANNTDAANLYIVAFGVATSGTPDVTMTNNIIATTDTVKVNSLTITVPTGSTDAT